MEQLLEREEIELTPDAPQPDAPRQGRNRFKKGFAIYLSVLGGVVLIALAALWIALARYQTGVDAEAAAQAEAAALAEERARDRAALQEALLRFAGDSGPEVWTDYYMQQPRLETRAGVEILISQLLDSHSPQCYKAESWSMEQPLYSIYLAEQPFARVLMEKRDGVWQPGQVELLLTGEEGGSLTVPEGTVLRCGDVLLEENVYADQPRLLCPAGPDRDALQDPVYGRTYRVSGLLTEPEFVLEQTPADLVAFDDGYAPALAPEQAKAYQDRAEELVQALVYYYLGGQSGCWPNMERAAGFTVPGSHAHQIITSSYDGVIWSLSFLQDYSCVTEPGEVLIWANNCYSVDVACQAYGANSLADKTMNGSYRIFFTDTGDGFGITELETL